MQVMVGKLANVATAEEFTGAEVETVKLKEFNLADSSHMLHAFIDYEALFQYP